MWHHVGHKAPRGGFFLTASLDASLKYFYCYLLHFLWQYSRLMQIVGRKHVGEWISHIFVQQAQQRH